MSNVDVGHFGPFGGRFVAETLIPALDELDAAWRAAKADPAFGAELDELLTEYVGRPSRLTFADQLSKAIAPQKRVRVYLKREDLNHTGAHKINNCVGQALLAMRMGKRRLIAETGAGQHGVATATVAARFGLDCEIFMGAEDMRRQAPNVERMKLLGAEVRPVEFGTKTLKEATSEAIRDWIANVETTHYLIGSCVGPAPYPELVRDLQRVIGDEAREQFLAADVLAAHVDDALEPEARAHRRGRDAVLAGAGLGDDAVLAEPPREHHLAERVVELVRAGVEEVFALEVDPLAGGEALRERERRRTARVRREEGVEFGAEALVLARGAPAGVELVERRDQRLGDIAPAVFAEVTHARAASTYARTRA